MGTYRSNHVTKSGVDNLLTGNIFYLLIYLNFFYIFIYFLLFVSNWFFFMHAKTHGITILTLTDFFLLLFLAHTFFTPFPVFCSGYRNCLLHNCMHELEHIHLFLTSN